MPFAAISRDKHGFFGIVFRKTTSTFGATTTATTTTTTTATAITHLLKEVVSHIFFSFLGLFFIRILWSTK